MRTRYAQRIQGPCARACDALTPAKESRTSPTPRLTTVCAPDRCGCDRLVDVRHGRKPHLGRMVDLSMGGERVVGALGLRSGIAVEMRLISPPEGISWAAPT